MRQIVLDTETTGLEPSQGHRVIEIGCVEIINRRLTNNDFHHYLNPDRKIDDAAIEIHGITNEQLLDKPRFAEIANDFLSYIQGAELIIHNAAFDVGFINNELNLVLENGGSAFVRCLDGHCTVLDTLKLARSMHPGQKNNLDALCRRYSIDNAQRTYHGALLDAQILADVYLVMTGGQATLFEESKDTLAREVVSMAKRTLDHDRPGLAVIRALADEVQAHQAWLEEIDKKSGGKCLWKKLEAAS